MQELDYITWINHEALRLSPPLQSGMFYEAKRDVTLGRYHFKRGDMLTISLEALGHDPE